MSRTSWATIVASSMLWMLGCNAGDGDTSTCPEGVSCPMDASTGDDGGDGDPGTDGGDPSPEDGGEEAGEPIRDAGPPDDGGGGGDAASGAPPMISSLEDRLVSRVDGAPDETTEVSFTVSDPDHDPAALTVKATASGSGVASSSVSVSCDAVGECTLSFDVVKSAFGQSTVTVTARDPGGLKDDESFKVVVGRFVTSTADTGEGTLRKLLNTAESGEVIGFDLDPGATITLETEIGIAGEVSIVGPSVRDVTIDAGGNSRALRVLSGGTVTITDLVFTNGYLMNEDGALILNRGQLTVERSVFRDTVGDNATFGTIYSVGHLTVRECVFENNDVTYGSAIATDKNTEITDSPVLLVEDSLFKGNTASNGTIDPDETTMTIRRSTFTGNHCTYGCGFMVYAPESPTTVVNSTFVNNTADVGDDGVVKSGGAIFVDSANLIIINSVIANNNAVHSGGGLEVRTGPVTLRNSIVHGNTSSESDNLNIEGTVTSGGHNLFGDLTGATVEGDGTGDITDASPMLGTLGDNGGPTPTLLPMAGSPVIDAVPSGSCNDTEGSLSVDQRGEPRPRGDGCEIGSVELQ